jgi:legumain
MPGAENHWVVVVAGSNTYSNYRHQADACHAYQIYKAKGVPEDHIILMAYDDIAFNSENPFKGKVYNKPDPKGPGVDVYNGCNIDYTGKTVIPATFKDVLLGTAEGKVLGSDEESYVHIAFFDHGAAGLIAFPKGELHKKEFQSILQQMSDDKKFKKLVFYLETCESGSMFVGMDIPNVYALSAANPSESSWGTYCGSDAKVNGKSIGSCLGDLFSVSWMEDTDAQDTTKEDLETQFTTVKQLTTKSEVMQWGDLSFTGDFVSEFVGGLTPDAMPQSNEARNSVSARQLDLYQAYHNYVSAESSEERLGANEKLQKVLIEQFEVETAYENFLSDVYPDSDQREAVRQGKAKPDNMECEMAAHTAFVEHGKFDANSGFAMQFHQYVVNVCGDESVANIDIVSVVARACGATILA